MQWNAVGCNLLAMGYMCEDKTAALQELELEQNSDRLCADICTEQQLACIMVSKGCESGNNSMDRLH